MNILFYTAAIVIMGIIIVKEQLKKRNIIDMDKITFFNKEGKKTSGKLIENLQQNGKTLVLLDAGENKATVMATLRTIAGIDYTSAKEIVNSVPAVFMSNIGDKQAELNKKALEYVGAKVDIK